MGYWRGRPRYGRGWGYGPGTGYGRELGNQYPYCRWNPALPRRWWAMPQYQHLIDEYGFNVPPAAATWDPTTGRPESSEAIDYEISMIKKQIEYLQDELNRLSDIKKSQPAKE